MGHMINQSEVL